MEGQTLKKWLDDNEHDVAWLARKLKITPQSVYEQLRKEKIGDVFKAKLLRAGITVFGKREEQKDSDEIVDVYKQLLEAKDTIITLLSENQILQKKITDMEDLDPKSKKVGS